MITNLVCQVALIAWFVFLIGRWLLEQWEDATEHRREMRKHK